MKKVNVILISAVAVLAMGCTKQIGRPTKGNGILTMTANVPATKAAYTPDQLLENALVNIYYADYSGLVRSYRYSGKPSSIYLPANEYRVDVIAGEAAKDQPVLAGWEQKSYKGSANVTINSGQNTTVSVEARVSNAISKVSFDESIASVFNSGYTLTIGVGENKLTYDASKSGKEGYFIISGEDEPAFAWTFNGTLASGNEAFTKSGTIEGIEAGKSYTLAFRYSIKDGFGKFDLLVDYDTEIVSDVINFEAVSNGIAPSAPYEIWAGHAIVHADVDEEEYKNPSLIKFSYSKDGSNWKTIDATRVSEGSYQAKLEGLSPETTYTYKLMIDGAEIGDPVTLTTAAAPQLPNSGFEYSSKSSSGKYQEWFDPSAPSADCRTAWWGSGNGSADEKGSADFGAVICRPDASTSVKGQSALLESTYASIKFAAGNLFSGTWAGLDGLTGGKVCFGRPFTARPTSLKVYLKYSTSKVNHIGGKPDGDNVSTNDYDRARVMIALGTWDRQTYGGSNESPVCVNTNDKSTFVDYATDPKTIGYGNLVLQGDASNSLNNWVAYEIPIDYRNAVTFPTHIIVSCASSMLGDYFTGCDTSKLWIDEMELVYE